MGVPSPMSSGLFSQAAPLESLPLLMLIIPVTTQGRWTLVPLSFLGSVVGSRSGRADVCIASLPRNLTTVLGLSGAMGGCSVMAGDKLKKREH